MQHGCRIGESGGLDDDAVGFYIVGECFKGVGKLPDEVAAYASVEKFLYTRYSSRGGECCVDFDVTVFVFQERKFVGFRELRNQVQDECCKVVSLNQHNALISCCGVSEEL